MTRQIPNSNKSGRRLDCENPQQSARHHRLGIFLLQLWIGRVSGKTVCGEYWEYFDVWRRGGGQQTPARCRAVERSCKATALLWSQQLRHKCQSGMESSAVKPFLPVNTMQNWDNCPWRVRRESQHPNCVLLLRFVYQNTNSPRFTGKEASNIGPGMSLLSLSKSQYLATKIPWFAPCVLQLLWWVIPCDL